jgi:threonyl-tRNA synthetase
MFVITLPDGSKRCYETALSVRDISLSIGKNIARETLAAVVNDNLVDTDFIIASNSSVRMVTSKDKEGLEILRHSCAHLLAQSVKQLYPSIQVAIGPVIENGFYYDFASEQPLTQKDLELIEKRMFELAISSQIIKKSIVSRDKAIKYFESLDEYYKVEIIKELSEHEPIIFYNQGNFTDLCRGPHVPNTSYLKAFKLMRVTGAYWRGNPENKMLTRIYGTCWSDKKDLEDYLKRLEEVQRRDHRKIGKSLDLFHFQDNSPGIAFWHPKGTAIWRTIEDYMRLSNQKYGCEEIKTPLIADITLWEKSGHAEKYADNLFITNSGKRKFAIRPMNCPTCVQVYNYYLHSYRDLPVRMSEFGIVHRNEVSGSLHGLLRVRSFTQDDGHIFCTEAQVEQEVTQMIKQCFEVYHDFGFNRVELKLALRPDNRVGSDQSWDKSEKSLACALENQGIEFDYLPGEGAFYGPKIEFHLKDAIGRNWQCGTIQLDLSMPARLGANFINENSKKQVPVMLHRAIVGSLERFIGILIEHYAGKLPVWLAPVQVVVISVLTEQEDYAGKIYQNLMNTGIRSQIDLRNEKIGFKIREHTLAQVPFIAIVGKKESIEDKITIRRQDGTDLGMMTLSELKLLVDDKIMKKGRLGVRY